MRWMRAIGIGTSTILILWISWTCKDEVSGEGGTVDVVFPDSNVSYGKHVEQLFIHGCGSLTICHSADTFTDLGFSLDSYDHLMFSAIKVVFPGDADQSPLIWSIEGTHGALKMPPPRYPQLNANQIKGMRLWVNKGAPPN